MAEKNHDSAPAADSVLEITRVFDAPRSLVFKAWADPGGPVNWWGPKDFTVTSSTMDVRPGGAWRACMRSPDGTDYWAQGVYREIVEPERLVFTWAWEDPPGKPGHETLVTLDFTQQGSKTKLTFRQSVFQTVKDRDEHQGGWNEAFDRLADYLSKA